MEMLKKASWVHEHFWKVGASQFRFCKHCNSTAPTEDVLEELSKNNRHPGTVYLGACKYDSSPSTLINHMRAKHAELLPAEVSEHRKTESGDLKDSEPDSDLLAQWAEEVVWQALEAGKRSIKPRKSPPARRAKDPWTCASKASTNLLTLSSPQAPARLLGTTHDLKDRGSFPRFRVLVVSPGSGPCFLPADFAIVPGRA